MSAGFRSTRVSTRLSNELTCAQNPRFQDLYDGSAPLRQAPVNSAVILFTGIASENCGRLSRLLCARPDSSTDWFRRDVTKVTNDSSGYNPATPNQDPCKSLVGHDFWASGSIYIVLRSPVWRRNAYIGDKLAARKWAFMPRSVATSVQLQQSPNTNQSWITATEAAAYLKIKPRTLLLWVNDGKVPAYALSGSKRRVWRFRQSDLDSALLARPVLPCPAPTVLREGRMI